MKVSVSVKDPTEELLRFEIFDDELAYPRLYILIFSFTNPKHTTSTQLSLISVSQQEIVCLYQRFCQLDRNAKGFISSDEFLSIPEFVMNPISQRLVKMVDGLNFKDFVAFLSAFSTKASAHQKIELIFKVYDSDHNGKVSFKDILEVLKDLSGSFMSDEQREEVLSQVLKEAGYSKDCYLTLDDFNKVLGQSGVKMDVEVPID